MSTPNSRPIYEVQQYENLPEIPHKTQRATIVGRVDTGSVEERLHGIALMIGHGEPTPEADDEMLRMAHLYKAAPNMKAALEVAKNRFETIRETNPEIDLEQVLTLIMGALWEAENEDISLADLTKICKARGEWTPSMEEEWGDEFERGESKLAALLAAKQ